MIIPTYTSSGQSCIGAKRIYANSSDLTLQWTCPECEQINHTHFDQVPFISYGSYCHSYYCHECNFECEDKMYTLNEIHDGCVDITIGKKYDLKAMRVIEQFIEIEED